MEELYEIIISIFRTVLPADVISQRVHWDNVPFDMLRQIYFAYGTQLEETEIEKKLHYLKDQVEFDLSNKPKIHGFQVFLLIQEAIEEALTTVHGEVVCRFENLPFWKILTNKVDSDIFVAAKYARIDYQNGKFRKTFTWKKIIGHNNIRLNTILEKGISDNHFHLFTSVHYFELSWLSLMNRMSQPKLIPALDKLDRERRNPLIRLGKDYRENSYAVLHMQAAFIRAYLYSFLTGSKIQLGTYTASWDWILRCVFRYEELHSFSNTVSNLQKKDPYIRKTILKRQFPRITWILEYCGLDPSETERVKIDEQIQKLRSSCERIPFDDCGWMLKKDTPEDYEREWDRQTIENLEHLLRNEYQISYSHKILQEIIDSFLYNAKSYRNKDYAMNFTDGWYEENEFSAVISGERWLLYSMFQKQERGEAKHFSRQFDLFFAYLLIKEKFRMELLQNNDKIGFGNFKIYQERKSWFTTQYSTGEMARIAVDTARDGQNLRSLELRIKPGMTFQYDAALIRRYDKEIKNGKTKEDDFYYVFHFSKKKDDTDKMPPQFNHMFYRHQNLRGVIRRQAEAIIKLRKRNPEIAKRLRGIDACSEEEGCRPEVFAVAYRILRNHSCYRGLSLSPEIPQLRATYHVGETFQDILDGLRAIDEAILFLNLDCGDRLGHATVLGLNVEKWYRDKAYVVTIKRQDYLDNIVWLYHQLIRYKASDMAKLLQYLETEFQLQFAYIFEKNLETTYIDKVIRQACKYDREYGSVENGGTIKIEFNIHTYYYSWMLRGDHPQLYADGYYKKVYQKKDLWDEYSVNQKYPKEKRIRYILSSVILNHYYHYSSEVKKAGNSVTTAEIPVNMVQGISFVQKQLQHEISERGIAIETNPTSNLMINRIRTYGEHPIVRFYNKGLTNDPEQLESCEQINTSINTDNQGTFSTSLSNEYALMACILGQQRDENGKQKYKRADIYEWIQNVQEMGNDQAFLTGKEGNINKGMKRNEKEETGNKKQYGYTIF